MESAMHLLLAQHLLANLPSSFLLNWQATTCQAVPDKVIGPVFVKLIHILPVHPSYPFTFTLSVQVHTNLMLPLPSLSPLNTVLHTSLWDTGVQSCMPLNTGQYLAIDLQDLITWIYSDDILTPSSTHSTPTTQQVPSMLQQTPNCIPELEALESMPSNLDLHQGASDLPAILPESLAGLALWDS